jgi:Flp pilus assembly protein TadG
VAGGTPAAGGTRNFLAWFKTHKQETALGAGGIVVAIALYVRQKNAAAGGSSSSGASSTTPATADTTDADLYNELESQIASLGQQTSSGKRQGQRTGSGTATAATGTTTSTSSSAPSAPPVTGYGETTLGGAAYDVLGDIGSGQAYSGYEVGGGAPVWFETPGGATPETNLSAAQVAGLPAGTEVLTPVAYGGEIGSAPVSSTTKGWG